MAIPTYSTVISQIDAYIVANGNNEITANVLNPILKVITDFANNTIGDLGTLTTSDTDTIVGAINSLKLAFDNLNNNGVQLSTGYNDPNITPPPSYNYADFYMELDITDDSPIQLWQWSGTEWNTYSNVYSKAEIDLIITNLESQISGIPKIQFTSDGVQTTFDLTTTISAKAVFWNGALLDDADFSQTDNILTLTFIPDAGAIIKPI